MAKIGTAHVEIKPVLDAEALEQLCKRIEDAVAAGVARGMAAGTGRTTFYVNPGNPGGVQFNSPIISDGRLSAPLMTNPGPGEPKGSLPRTMPNYPDACAHGCRTAPCPECVAS